jgi:hypothetical protein
VQLQHLLDPGPRGGGDRGGGDPGLRLEGRDAGGVLVVHRAGAELAGRGRAEHDPRRRWRRDPTGPQRRRVRGGGRGPGPLDRGLRGVPDRARDADPLARERRDAVDQSGRPDQGRHRGDDDRRAPALPAGRGRRAAVPGDQRQRLGHQVEVRQPLRLPPLADRRHQPRHRRDDRRQGRRRLRLRRRRQGLRVLAAGPGRSRDHHRDRPDLRAAGGDGGLRGAPSRRRATRTSSPSTTCRG